MTAPPQAHDVRARRVLVVGLAGAGVAAARALRARGADVRAVDSDDGAEVRARAELLRARGCQVRTGSPPSDLTPLEDRDLVVTSPGVPPHAPLLARAVADGTPVWSEPELAWRLGRAAAGGSGRLVAVTGTNGKTSTTELLAACLDVPAAGNIGTPLTDVLAAAAPPPLVVAELSSFQLHFTVTLRADVAVLLNLAPDHLDWHGSPAAYGDAKARIWAQQGEDDVVVANADDHAVTALLTRHVPPGRVVTFTAAAPGVEQVGVRDGRLVARLGGGEVDLVGLEELAVRGHHHVANAAAAAAAALTAGADAVAVRAALRSHHPGPHRMALVARRDGVCWVDDSKATNPHAAAAALASYPSVVWIAGGLGKGLSFGSLSSVVASRVHTTVTIGAAGPEVAAMAAAAGSRVVQAGTLARAVPAAAEAARPGDTVLLSPACASMDQFSGYAARGDAFAAAVHELAAGGAVDGSATPPAAGGSA